MEAGSGAVQREAHEGQQLHDLVIEAARLDSDQAAALAGDSYFDTAELQLIRDLAARDTLRELSCWSAGSGPPSSMDCTTWRWSEVGQNQLLRCCTEPAVASIGMAIRLLVERRFERAL
jgi:hypothetical protein